MGSMALDNSIKSIVEKAEYFVKNVGILLEVINGSVKHTYYINSRMRIRKGP